jgi:hypothetical protein
VESADDRNSRIPQYTGKIVHPQDHISGAFGRAEESEQGVFKDAKIPDRPEPLYLRLLQFFGKSGRATCMSP